MRKATASCGVLNGTGPAPADATGAPLVVAALQGKTWTAVADELNLAGLRRRSGEEWDPPSARHSWLMRCTTGYSAFRFDAQMLPVIDAGVAGWGWDDVRDLLHRSGRGATPAGLAWTSQRLETAFSEFAGRAERQTREKMIAGRAAGRSKLPHDDPTVASLSYRIMRLPGLRRPDAYLEGSLRGEPPFVEPLVAAGCVGAGWGDIADVLTAMELDVPEPFDVWCGLLVRRLWMCATIQSERQPRSRCRRRGAAGYEQAFAAARDSLEHGVDGVRSRL